MTKPLNPEKSKQLRPLRIVLAILVAILIILILDRLPTSVKDRPENTQSTTKEVAQLPEGAKYYYFDGFLEILETQIEEQLKNLGVPQEEYQNLAEYLTKDEMFEIEAKVTLAAYLDSDYVVADALSLNKLQTIFQLGDDYDFEQFEAEITPTEYKNLADLIDEYHKTLTTVEDYDIQE